MNGPNRAGKYVKFAWLSLIGYVLSFALSFTVGEGLASMLGEGAGHPSGSGYPGWVIALSAAAALLVFAVPGFVAWWFGRKAVRAGDPRGRIPGWLGLGIAFGFAVMNVVALIAPRL